MNKSKIRIFYGNTSTPITSPCSVTLELILCAISRKYQHYYVKHV